MSSGFSSGSRSEGGIEVVGRVAYETDAVRRWQLEVPESVLEASTVAADGNRGVGCELRFVERELGFVAGALGAVGGRVEIDAEHVQLQVEVVHVAQPGDVDAGGGEFQVECVEPGIGLLDPIDRPADPLAGLLVEQRQPQQCDEGQQDRQCDRRFHHLRHDLAARRDSDPGCEHLIAREVRLEVAVGVGVALHSELPAGAVGEVDAEVVGAFGVEWLDRRHPVGHQLAGQLAGHGEHVADLDVGGRDGATDDQVAGHDPGLHRAGDDHHRLDVAELAGDPDATGGDAEQCADPEGDRSQNSDDAHDGILRGGWSAEPNGAVPACS